MIFKGRNLEEAIENAQRQLGKSIDKFTYNINERKIGIFKKEVEINVDIHSDKDKVVPKAQGEIINKCFKFYSGEGKVLIKASSKVKLKLNGKFISKDVYVDKNDTLELIEVIKPSSKKIIIEVDNDKLRAALKIESNPTIIYHIKDHDKSPIINFNFEEEIKNDEENITIDEVKAELFKNGIKYGIDTNLIKNAIIDKKGVVAVGKDVVESIDDRIIYYFDNDDKKKHVEINGKVDYYSIEEIESVEKDSVIAVLEEGENGENGVDVFGSIISPKPRKNMTLKVGTGAYISEDMKYVRAEINGRANIKGNKICVLPIFQINGDADMKIGNLEFDGDIFVTGDVKEGMKISAGGSIQIGKSVLESSLHSKGDVKISENLIASTVKVGNIELNEINYIEKLQEIKTFLGKCIELTEELQNIMGKKARDIPKSTILKKVIDSKFSDQKQKLKKIKIEYSKVRMCSNITEIYNKFFKIYEDILDGENINFQIVSDIHFEIEKFLDQYDITKTSADVYMRYSQNSKIYSSRNVYINGKGCYSTEIEAEGKVFIEGSPGTFRSGTVYGKEGVYIKEIGSVAGVKSIIKTDISGEIVADIIYNNTLLIIGDFNYYVDEGIKKVKIFVKDGELIIEKFKL